MTSDKIQEAINIITALGLPTAQQNERSALTLLALANIGPQDNWKDTKQVARRVHDIIVFIEEKYKKKYAENSRETIRRQTLHQFVQAGVADLNSDDPSRPTNSGKNSYTLTTEAIAVLRAYATSFWSTAASDFLKKTGGLQEQYARRRELLMIPVKLASGKTFTLSPGEHNLLQKSIIEEFAPRFAPGSLVLYCGDTSAKDAIYEEKQLARIGIKNTHDKLPDVVLLDKKNEWLLLIEAVTSHGPVSPKRYFEIEKMMSACKLPRVYVTAFLDKGTFRKYSADIAWETEAWIADNPDHMIHFNGDKFLGPYRK